MRAQFLSSSSERAVTCGFPSVVAFALLAATAAAQSPTVGDTRPSDSRPTGADSRGAAEDPTTVWFRTARPTNLKITLTAEAADSLRKEPRTFVRARLAETDGPVLAEVGIRLKGSAGSFRDFDDRPGFTIDCAKFGGTELFHGLRRFHLNNAAQDDTLLREGFAYETFRAAGYPAPFVSHARVAVDARDLGVYVVKESYDQGFLLRRFGSAAANLYDGGANGEVFDDLDLDVDLGVPDRADLKRLAAACRESDLDRRRILLTAAIDIPRFLDFMALESLVDHWDGYTWNPNNYRLCFPADSGRGFFIPHGMDQVFRDVDARLFDPPRGAVASVVLADPELRAGYRSRLKALLPLLSPPDAADLRIVAAERRIAEFMKTATPPEAFRGWRRAVRGFRNSVRERAKFLAVEVDRPEPPVLRPDAAGLSLAALEWRSHVEGDTVAETRGVGDAERLVLRAGGNGRSIGSWRAQAFVARGRYELTCPVDLKDVVGLEGESTKGAGVRISGARRESRDDPEGREGREGRDGRNGRKGPDEGTADSRPSRFTFEVEEAVQRVEFVLDLRARSGEAAFLRSGLKIARR